MNLPDRDYSLPPGTIGERERRVFNRVANTQAATAIVVLLLFAAVIGVYEQGRQGAADTLGNRTNGYTSRALACDNIIINHPHAFTVHSLPMPCQDPNVVPLIAGDPTIAPLLIPIGP